MPMADPMDPSEVPGVKIDGPPRRYVAPEFVKAMDPEGTIHKLARDNQRDWLMRPGHAILGPWEDDAEKVGKKIDQPADESSEEVTTSPKPAAEVLEPLEELRRQARDLGIDVKQTWGKKRLNDEITKAQKTVE